MRRALGTIRTKIFTCQIGFEVLLFKVRGRFVKLLLGKHFAFLKFIRYNLKSFRGGFVMLALAELSITFRICK